MGTAHPSLLARSRHALRRKTKGWFTRERAKRCAKWTLKASVHVAALGAVIAALVAPEQIQGIVSSTVLHWPNKGPACDRSEIALGRWASHQDAGLEMPVAEVMSISQQSSPAYHGQAALEVTVSARPATQSWLVIAEGRYGQRSTSDFEAIEEEAVKRPNSKECAQWNRIIDRNEDEESWERVVTFDGLWGQDTYCFTVHAGKNYEDILAGNFETSAPECHEIKWNPSWGWMESPGTT